MGSFLRLPQPDDIDRIWDYTAEHWNADQADHYTDGIHDICCALVLGRKRGRPTQARRGYLKYPVGSHLIFFRHLEEGIEVIRILHQSMDFDRHL